jgi:hypothetical protein
MHTQLSSGEQLEMQYEKTVKFFNFDSAKALNISEKDKGLVSEAARYAYPIEHHHVDIINGIPIDTLVIIRPPASSSESTTAGGTQTEQSKPTANEPEIIKSERIEITANRPPEPKQNNPEKQNQIPLRLSSDPRDAYPIVLPPQLFASGTIINGEIQIASNFNITNIENQKELEPAYRIYIIAKAFVDQKVPIKQNACNYFVRAVMNVAGYTKLSNLMANQFHLAFQKPAHGLNKWNRENYKYTSGGAGSAQQSLIASDLLSTPSQHGSIFQSIRNDKDNGHVGIAVPIDGKLMFFDSALNQRKPGYKFIRGSDLLNKDRKNVNVFSLPGMRKTRRVSL